MLIDGEKIDFCTDTAVWMPSNTYHQVINDNPYEMLRVFWVIHPPFGGDTEIIDAWKKELDNNTNN